MKKLILTIFLVLALITWAGKAFGENDFKNPGKTNFKLMDHLFADFKFMFYPIETLNRMSQTWTFQLNMSKPAENEEWVGAKPILNLGYVPEGPLRYQPDTLFQWGYTLGSSVLLLRFGAKTEDLEQIDSQSERDNTYILNFLIDFWFK
jgi:hypothetical protein